MKRVLAAMVALVLLLAIPIISAEAAGNSELGEMLITSQKQSVAVGDVVKVNFELYPNLPDGRKLDSLSGSMKFDTEFLTLGTINQVDTENNLTSLMKGKASSFQYKFDEATGAIRFAFIDAYGVDKDGFWFQAEFRVEKEGATDFVFNGITYTGVDSKYKTASFYINPVSVGGLYTEGQSIPTDGAADETFAPLTPAVNTPVPSTPTPKPSNSGHDVPVTSTLPTYSANPSSGNTGVVTPKPPVTSAPTKTQAPSQTTAEPSVAPSTGPTDAETPASSAEPDATPGPEAEGNTSMPETTEAAAIVIPDEPEETEVPINPDNSTTVPSGDSSEQQASMLLIVGVIIGLVAVVGLGALAIVLILKRRNMDD